MTSKATSSKNKNKSISEIIKEIELYKLSCEANIVSCLWKQPELFRDYDKLKLEDFTHNEWKVFYTIGKEIVVKEDKPVLDEFTVGFYLEKHDKLKEKYIEYGGYNTIESAKAYVQIENLNGYIEELNKWNMIIKLINKGYPITSDKLKYFKDMTSEEIYDEYEAQLNDIAINVSSQVKSYNLCEDIDKLLEECDKGVDVGLPIKPPILNNVIGGNALGNITLLGGLSGIGKTTLSIEWLLPSIFEHDEQIVVMINEEDENKWRKEFLTYIISNIKTFIDENGNTVIVNPKKIFFNKKRFREGKFTSDEWEVLRNAQKYLEMKKNNRNVTIIPLEQYSTALVIKIIKKYASLGVNYFILDTFKHDYKSQNEQIWLQMMQDMVKIYDVIKPVNKNVHIWITFQLSKGSVRQRYMSQDNIGMARNMIDVASTCILVRHLRDDEYPDGKNEVKVYRLEGKNGRSKIPVKLDKNKHYVIVFIEKNRRGESKQFQIVAENNLGINTYEEVGICNIPMDY